MEETKVYIDLFCSCVPFIFTKSLDGIRELACVLTWEDWATGRSKLDDGGLHAVLRAATTHDVCGGSGVESNAWMAMFQALCVLDIEIVFNYLFQQANQGIMVHPPRPSLPSFTRPTVPFYV
jgi:hypothetical protein